MLLILNKPMLSGWWFEVHFDFVLQRQISDVTENNLSHLIKSCYN